METNELNSSIDQQDPVDRTFFVVATFSYKHGALSKKVTCPSVDTIKKQIRKAFEISETEFNIFLINEGHELVPFSISNFDQLKREIQIHIVPVKKKKRIGLIGGSFDPITDGHVKLCGEIINTRFADEVFIKNFICKLSFERILSCYMLINYIGLASSMWPSS